MTTPRDPVFYVEPVVDEPGWYYWNKDFTVKYGPYPDEETVRKFAKIEHVQHLLGHCAYCGSALTFVPRAEGRCAVNCNGCGASGPSSESRDMAIESWKRLHPVQPNLGPAKGRAYIVLVIDPKTATLRGAGIFSETNPTLGALVPVSLWEATGKNYEDAHRNALKLIAESPHFQWVDKILDERSRKVGELP